MATHARRRWPDLGARIIEPPLWRVGRSDLNQPLEKRAPIALACCNAERNGSLFAG